MIRIRIHITDTTRNRSSPLNSSEDFHFCRQGQNAVVVVYQYFISNVMYTGDIEALYVLVHALLDCQKHTLCFVKAVTLCNRYPFPASYNVMKYKILKVHVFPAPWNPPILCSSPTRCQTGGQDGQLPLVIQPRNI